MEVTADHPAAKAEFLGREAEGFLGEGFWNTGDFKEHGAGEHAGIGAERP